MKRYEMDYSSDLKLLQKWTNDLAKEGWKLLGLTSASMTKWDDYHEPYIDVVWTAVMEIDAQDE